MQVEASPTATESTLKRKQSPATPSRASASKKKKAGASLATILDNTPLTDPQLKDASEVAPMPLPGVPATVSVGGTTEIIPPTLVFSLDEAKRHLSAADARFHKLFETVPCKPFEVIDAVEPFRQVLRSSLCLRQADTDPPSSTLASSILGQQISWKAARSIKHKFIRLYDSSLPEVPPPPGEKPIEFFPSAHQVSTTPIPTLRAAGLSARKAEYVIDLASRFADGRLSASKLAESSDQEIYDMLIAVKGIGPWTVEMFLIFSLRRPDVLPCGDLGVQKGLLRWVYASHSTEASKKLRIAPHRLPGAPDADEETRDDSVVMASPQKEAPLVEGEEPSTSVLPAPSNLSVLPATPTKKSNSRTASQPSTLAALFSPAKDNELVLNPITLPDGLSIAMVKSRLAGKKVKKGVFLTPEEMKELTARWAPYRSLAVWYMWSIVDEGTAS
ncbi:hypothetical protein FRB96_005058 [Tulasnella sp. 330]|nr:hypothetical protein FRB96_005058 [Tulasnella sp. 330]